MSKERKKKQKVIHTRVSEAMDEELKERAERLGVSVSNLVRNVLQNTLDLVEEIVQDSAKLARSARSEVEATEQASAPAQASGEVIGWQVAVLNRNALCETCNALLPKGTEAAVGITDGPGSRPILCSDCLKELGGNGKDDTEEE